MSLLNRESNVNAGRRESFGIRAPGKISNDFDDIIDNSLTGIRQLINRAGKGDFKSIKCRTVVWKMMLGYIPMGVDAENWESALRKRRDEYEKLLETHTPDPTRVDESEVDLSVCNPLASVEDTPTTSKGKSNVWTKFYEANELRKEILKDLERLYPTGCGDFFEVKSFRESMGRILFLWSSMNADTSYRQGMHEVLAPLFYKMMEERLGSAPSEEEKKCLTATQKLAHIVMNEAHVEADTFWMFDTIMKQLKPLFRVQSSEERAAMMARLRKKREERGVGKRAVSIGDLPQLPLQQCCNYIQHTIVKQADPELYARLDEFNIEPQLYAIKWIRTLFTRAFHVDDVYILWDTIFASMAHDRLESRKQDKKCSPPLVRTVEFLAASMVMYVRTFVLEHDYSSSLKRLMKFPPMEDVLILVRNAQRMETCKGQFSKLRRDGLKPIGTKVPPPLPPWPSNKEKRPASGVSSKTSAVTSRQVHSFMKATFGKIGAGISAMKNTKPFSPTRSATTNNTSSKAKAPDISRPFNVKHKTKKSFVEGLKLQLKKQTDTQKRLGSRLDKLVNELQNLWIEDVSCKEKKKKNKKGHCTSLTFDEDTFDAAVEKACKKDDEEEEEEEDEETEIEVVDTNRNAERETAVLQSIAEMGMIRDVLLGRIQEEDCNWMMGATDLPSGGHQTQQPHSFVDNI